MRPAALALIGAFALCGCTRHTNQESAAAAKPNAASAAANASAASASAVGPSAAGAAQAPGAASASAERPSYEVAIASAQADRVRALNGCDDKQGAVRAACVRQADSAYNQARDAAEMIRGNER